MPALLEVILRQSLLITGKIDLSGSCQNEKPDVLSGNKMPKPSGPAVTCWRYKYSSGWMVPTWRMRIRTVTVAVPWARQDSRLTKSGKLKLHASIRINLTFPLDNIFREALIKAGKGEVSSQKRRKCQGKERIEGRNPWNSYTSQLKGRKSPMRVGVNRPLWQAYTDLRWRRARVIG